VLHVEIKGMVGYYAGIENFASTIRKVRAHLPIATVGIVVFCAIAITTQQELSIARCYLYERERVIVHLNIVCSGMQAGFAGKRAAGLCMLACSVFQLITGVLIVAMFLRFWSIDSTKITKILS
jgi:hypothetical protein